MSKTPRSFWLDIALFTLLSMNIATLGKIQPGALMADLSIGGHIHIFSGILLTLACLVHIGLHWRWFQAVLTGKVKGKIKLVMKSMVIILMLLAGVSGPLAHASSQASRFHSAVGSLAILGLFIHAVKHLRWMTAATRKLIAGGRQENARPAVQAKGG
jgi:hypothetical protein